MAVMSSMWHSTISDRQSGGKLSNQKASDGCSEMVHFAAGHADFLMENNISNKSVK